MAESKLMQRLKKQGLAPITEGKTLKGSGDTIIDADTFHRGEDKYRLPGFDAPEVGHWTPENLQYKPGDIGGQETTDITQGIIEDEGYDNIAPVLDAKGKPKKDIYGRFIGNRSNDLNQGLSERLLLGGIADTNSFSSQYHKDISAVSGLERAQRRTQGEETSEDLFRRSVQNATQNYRQHVYGSAVEGKPMAASERLYAQNPGRYSGVANRDLSRNMDNTARGFQLDDAWSRGSKNLWASTYAASGILLDLVGANELADEAHGHAARKERQGANLPFQRNGSIQDVNGFVDFLDWGSSTFVNSLPIMGTTIIAAGLAPVSGGLSLSAPLAIYTGMNYNEQPDDKKDSEKAFKYAILQSALDLVGVKAGGGALSKFFLNTEARKQTIQEVAKQLGKNEVEAENILLKAMKGQFQKGVALSQDQIGTMAKTNKEIALGLGLNTVGGGAIEGTTEVAQEYLSMLASNREYTAEQTRDRLINAFAAGGVLGGTFGAVESGAITDYNYNVGLQKEVDSANVSRDLDGNEVYNNDTAYEWVGNQVASDLYTDKYAGDSLYSRAEKDVDSKGWIDNTLKNATALVRGKNEQGLRKFQGKGEVIDRLISPWLDTRGGGTIEERRQMIMGDLVDKAVFSERSSLSGMGFRTPKAFGKWAWAKENKSRIDEALTAAITRGKPLKLPADLADNPQRVAFLQQVVDSSRAANVKRYGNANGGGHGETVNVMERGFSPNTILKEQQQFEDDLIKYKGLPMQQAQELSAVLTNTETIVEPVDVLDEFAGLADSKRNKYKQALEGLSKDPNFARYLEQNPFNNIAQNGIKQATAITSAQYFGVRGEKINDGLSKAVRAGDISESDSVELAKFFRDDMQILSGTYNIVTNKTYNKVMNLGTAYATLNMLEKAAISSLPEFATTVFHNTPGVDVKKEIFPLLKNAVTEISTSLSESANYVSRGIIPMTEYGNNRAKLRELGFLSEQTAPAARVGAEYSPSQARHMQQFFNAIQLNSSTNLLRGLAVTMADPAVDSLLMQGAIHYPVDGVKNRHYNQAVKELDALGIPGAPLIEKAYQVNVLKEGSMAAFEAEVETHRQIARIKFTDQRVMTPRKGNRPKWASDPRLRLFTTFTGYISTATAVLLPKLYNNLAGKGSLPAQRVGALKTMLAMLLMAQLAIAVKQSVSNTFRDDDEKKKSKKFEDYEFQDYLRRLKQSGLLGVYERPINLIAPDFQPRSNIGAGVSKINGTLGSLVNLGVSNSPIVQNVDKGIGGVISSWADPEDKNATKYLLDGLPGASDLHTVKYIPTKDK